MNHPRKLGGVNAVVPYLLTFVLLGILSDPVLAQPRAAPEYVLSEWNVDEGLPVNSVISMVVGPDGFLWLATLDGLARFDGSGFTVFSAATTPELPSSRFSKIFEGPDGELWATTEQGEVVRYRYGTFTHVDSRLGLEGRHAAIEAPRRASIVTFPTTAGLGIYRPDADTVTMVAGLDFGAEVADALPDTSIWVGGLDGRLAFVDPSGRVRQVGPTGLLQDHVRDLRVDRHGTVWILTMESLLRREGDAFVRVRDPDGAPWVPGENTWLEEDPSGRIWVIDRPGLFVVENNTAHPVHPEALSPEAPVPSSLRGNDGHVWTYGDETLYRNGVPVLQTGGAVINEIVFGSDQSVWVATSRGGLMHLRPTPIRTYGTEVGLPSNNLYPVLADRRGNIWVGTLDAGLGCYGSACPSAESPSPGILAFHLESDGTLWAGGYGLYRLEGGRFVPVPSPIPYPDRIRAIHRDRRGILWVGSELGLARGQAMPDGSWRFDLYRQESGMTHDWVRLLAETRDGTLWAGTNGGGLMRIRSREDPAERPQFEPFTEAEGLCSNNIRHLYEDGNGILWIATEDRGLCRVEIAPGAPISSAAVTAINRRHGLFDDALHHVAEDEYGRLWMSSNRGLFWVEITSLNAFVNGSAGRVFSTVYTERDGLRSREFNGGVQPAGTRDTSGRLWFPTQDGLVSIDPSDVLLPTPPAAVVQRLLVGDQTLNAASSVTLAPDRRDVRIDYGAAYFGHPDELWFRYRLLPYDTEWRYTASERTAVYTNLEPGTYTFEVAAGSAGHWQAEPATLTITRRPFFFETAWFYALLFLGLVLVGFLLHGVRLKRIQQHGDKLERKVHAATKTLTEQNEQLNSQNVQLRAQESQLAEQARQLLEMDEAKTRFFANTSHELRTPLTLMLEPLRELLESQGGSLPDGAKKTLDLVYRNGLRLRRLINQTLDLSRLESGGMQLDFRKADLVPFLRRAGAAFESSARMKNLTLRFVREVEALPSLFDIEAMEKVVANLLSNAIKFTPPAGTVELTVGVDEQGWARIRVSDTGPGIPAEALERIFDRFYQVDTSSTRHHEGTGIGLAIARELVSLHGGSLKADTPPEGGAVFTVRLPDIDRAETQPIRSVSEVVSEPGPAASFDADDSSGGGDMDAGVYDVTIDVASSTPSVTIRGGDGGPSASDDAAESDGTERPDETVILVVEDNPDMRAYVAATLQVIGRVIVAPNGEVGKERAYGEIPDLIVSDVMMPGSDGFELCSALKNDPRTSHIPILLLTARADVASRMEGYDLGADDYLAKPFSKLELLARSRNLLANRRRLHEHFQRGSIIALPNADLPSRDAQFLEDVATAMKDNLGDPEFGVERLAEASAMSARQLLRKLEALTGQSPSDMLRRERMERAGAMLRQDAGSIKEIAYAVGYRSASSFRKAFKEHFGASPSAFSRGASN